ncbi:glycosyltransferase, partial [Escherichia coli]
VKLSTVEGMFGPPLEIYHTGGTSISYDVTGYDEYIEHNVNGLVSFSRQNQEIIEFINRLKDNPNELAQLKANALATAEKWPDWESSSKEFAA